MPRGRQYYDPIVQIPGKVGQADNLERIELFPVTEDSRPEFAAQIGKWIGRRIAADGSVTEIAPGDFDHDRALAQAQMLWPGLDVFELRSEGEDSTWTGAGPSPRLWQGSPPVAGATAASPPAPQPPGGSSLEIRSEAGGEQLPAEADSYIRAFTVSAGTYVLLDDICELLERWAVQFEVEKNPSGALALREAVDALKAVEVG